MVAVFSGYFTLGQFRFFTGTHNGKRSAAFAQKLLKSGHAASRDYIPRGLVFHLFSRTIYEPIGKDNLRNRKRHSFDFVRTRLVLFDFVLANQHLDYFETERKKVDFFCQRLGIPSNFLPAKVYKGSDGQQTTRYFVDKFPLFMALPSQVLPLWSHSATSIQAAKARRASPHTSPPIRICSANSTASGLCISPRRTLTFTEPRSDFARW
jgi:hypothetical protein